MLLLLTSLALATPPAPVPGLSLPAEQACLAAPSLADIEAGATTDGDVTMAASTGLTSRQIKTALGPFYRHLDACGRRGAVVPAGEEIVEMTVACTGRVDAVFAMGAATDWPEAVTSCVVDALHYAAFPAHALPGGAVFMIPLRFTDAGKPGEATAPEPTERLASSWAKEAEPSDAPTAGGPERRSRSVVGEGRLSTSGPVELSEVGDIALPTMPSLPSTPARPAASPQPAPSRVARATPPRPAPSPAPRADPCAGGSAAACYQLAKRQAADRNVRKAVARETLGKACDAGGTYPPACFLLGVYRENGVGGDRDRTEAVQAFRRACDGGHAQSCHRKGALLTAGVGVRRDDAAALADHRKACALGLAEACIAAGRILETGTFVRKDVPAADALFATACDDGEGAGCAALGGLREDTDPAGAREAYEAGVALGDLPSMRRLGRLLWLGLGGGKSKGRAKSLCMDACEAGDKQACRGPALQ